MSMFLHFQEIRQFYLSSLCRDAKVVEVEESSVDLANSATVAKLSESTSKVGQNISCMLSINVYKCCSYPADKLLILLHEFSLV